MVGLCDIVIIVNIASSISTQSTVYVLIDNIQLFMQEEIFLTTPLIKLTCVKRFIKVCIVFTHKTILSDEYFYKIHLLSLQLVQKPYCSVVLVQIDKRICEVHQH